MNAPRSSALKVMLAIGLLAVVLCGLPGPLPGAAAAPVAGSVQVTVQSLSRSTPVAGSKPSPFTARLRLTNTTRHLLRDLRVEGARGDPISNPQALDAALNNPQEPDPTLVGRFAAQHPVTVTLPAGASTIVDYVSSTGAAGVSAGMCLCQNRIYPLYFTVHYVPASGVDTVVGSAQTVVPSFTPDNAPKPTQVSWVWPILEPPHRTVSDDVFTDDSLAASVATGRLDRLLRVVEDVGGTVPLTVLIDPDLLDELAVMATGKYRVLTSGDSTTAGIGADAARSWLARFRNLLATDPNVHLALTPYADPDIESLTRNGLSWSNSLPAAAETRVAAILDGHDHEDIAWPVGNTLSQPTLDALDRQGTSVVLLDDRTLPGVPEQPPASTGLARLKTGSGSITAAVAATSVEQYVGTVIGTGGTGLASLPELIAEVAIGAVQDGTTPHYVVITPPRDVDPDPAAAARAILDTSRSTWSRPIALSDAVTTVKVSDHGHLTPQHQNGLPDTTVDTAHYAIRALPTLTGLIADATEAKDAFGGIPAAVQRSESAEWHDQPRQSVKIARQVRAQVDQLLRGVYVVRPSTGTYTFGSANSPLPITIANTLDVTVAVRLRISTVGGVVGFTARDVGELEIEPHSRLPLHVASHIDPVRRIKVQVQLLNAAGETMGAPLQVSVRSTALGAVGKVITFAAAGLLALALMLRLYRRLRHRRPRTLT